MKAKKLLIPMLLIISCIFVRTRHIKIIRHLDLKQKAYLSIMMTKIISLDIIKLNSLPITQVMLRTALSLTMPSRILN